MNIGMQELLVICVLALIVLGPERLPGAIKTLAVWSSRMRRSFNDLKSAVEREIDADEIRQQIHNETVLHELGETREALESFGKQASAAVSLEQNEIGKAAPASKTSSSDTSSSDTSSSITSDNNAPANDKPAGTTAKD